MAIRYEHVEPIKATPERVFAVVDDLPFTVKWLPPCVSLDKVGAGPNAVGDALKYVYEQGGRQGEMTGRIADRVPNQRLHCVYDDSMFGVSVDLTFEPSSEGTKSTHRIEITPKTFLARLMSPLVKLGIGKQTREAAGNLKALIESNGA